MKRRNIVLGIFLTNCLAMIHAQEVNGLWYAAADEGTDCVALIPPENGTRYQGDIVIPSQVTIRGHVYTVTQIGRDEIPLYGAPFWECDGVSSVEIPNTITKISQYAFSGCGLTELKLPHSVKVIGERAFSHCAELEDLVLQDGVDSISNSAFSHCSKLKTLVIDSPTLTYLGDFACDSCTSLETVTIAAGKLKNIGFGTFEDCSSLKSVTLPDNLEVIGESAFYRCRSLERILLPDQLEFIKKNAFERCGSLQEIVIPKNVYDISATPFSGCSNLTSIIVDGDNKYYDSRNRCNAIIISATNTLIAGCRNSSIPQEVTRIRKGAFWDTGITSVVLPNGLKTIEATAFAEPELLSISIPASVTSLNRAFSGCGKLSRITSFIEQPYDVHEQTFEGIDPDATLYVLKGTKELYQNAVGWNRIPHIVEMGETGITETVNNDRTQVPIYSLSGRQLGTAKKGVNIIGGKKVVVK